MSKRWGEPTWYFFHTFIEKITDAFYNSNYKKCINVYKIICNNLPCPICREHATNYLRNYKIDDMNTRVKMKIFLLNFHNDVNKRLNKTIYTEAILAQYSRINVIKAYQFFNQEFYVQNYMSKNFSGWIRNKIREELDLFFKNNICHFRA